MLVLFPGASLMEITSSAEGVLVRCPGCGESLLMPAIAAGGVQSQTFAHEDDCPVLARIEAARQTYERTTVRRG